MLLAHRDPRLGHRFAPGVVRESTELGQVTIYFEVWATSEKDVLRRFPELRLSNLKLNGGGKFTALLAGTSLCRGSSLRLPVADDS